MASDAEVSAAKTVLDQAAKLAGRDQPVPSLIVRHMLEAAEGERLREYVALHPQLQ